MARLMAARLLCQWWFCCKQNTADEAKIEAETGIVLVEHGHTKVRRTRAPEYGPLVLGGFHAGLAKGVSIPPVFFMDQYATAVRQWAGFESEKRTEIA